MRKFTLILMVGLGFLLGGTLVFAEKPMAMHYVDGNDTIVIKLPNQSEVIIVVQNLGQLAEMGEVSVDSILMDLSRQLNSQPYPGDTVMDFILDENARLKTPEPQIIKYDLREADTEKSRKMNFGFNGGADLVPGTFAPAAMASVTFRSGKNQFGLGLRAQLIPSRSGDRWRTDIAAFGTGIYGRNFSRDPQREQWHRVSLGYRFAGTGNFHPDHAMVLTYMPPGSPIQPQLYFTPDLRSVYPGISVMF